MAWATRSGARALACCSEAWGADRYWRSWVDLRNGDRRERSWRNARAASKSNSDLGTRDERAARDPGSEGYDPGDASGHSGTGHCCTRHRCTDDRSTDRRANNCSAHRRADCRAAHGCTNGGPTDGCSDGGTTHRDANGCATHRRTDDADQLPPCLSDGVHTSGPAGPRLPGHPLSQLSCSATGSAQVRWQ
jgi:hypothetical protein